jgi:phosphoglycolate phosphatase
MYSPIVFDLDGTLTDSKQGIVAGIQYALEKEGLPPFDEERIIAYIGGPLREVICEHHGLDDEAATRLIAQFRDYYRRIGIYENRLFPGVKELLEMLRRQGRRLAIATAKPTASAHLVLALFGIADRFEVVSGSDVAAGRGTKAKILEYALKGLAVDGSARAVMIGDRRYDIEAAHENEVDSIGLVHGYGNAEELREAGATHVVKTTESLGCLLGLSCSLPEQGG